MIPSFTVLMLIDNKEKELTKTFPDNWLEGGAWCYMDSYLENLHDIQSVVADGHGIPETGSGYWLSYKDFIKDLEQDQSSYEYYPLSNNKIMMDFMKTFIINETEGICNSLH